MPLTQHPEAYRILYDYYGEEHLNERRLRMARTPEGAGLIDNPVSAAPGFIVENVYVMAGIPKVLQAMVEGLVPQLEGGTPLLSQTVTVELPESVVANVLEQVEEAHPGLQIGSYPFQSPRGFGVNIVLRSEQEAQLESAAAALTDQLAALAPPAS